MHKQSQIQKGRKIIICHFKKLGCCREVLNSRRLAAACPVMQAIQSHGSPGMPGAAMALALSHWLYLWTPQQGTISPDNSRGRRWLLLPTPHLPWVNPGHMQTADFIPHAPSNDRDLEHTQARDWPLAKVILYWEVRIRVHSLSQALPNSNRWRPEGIWGKTKAISTLPGHFQIALKSTEWRFYQQCCLWVTGTQSC